MTAVVYLLVCRLCGDPARPLPVPFSSPQARGRWAAGHTDATGHNSWLVLDQAGGRTLISFTCPRRECGRTSYNPNDVREGYCGACHDWTGREAAAAAEPLLMPARVIGAGPEPASDAMRWTPGSPEL
jgi:hypothetical protein